MSTINICAYPHMEVKRAIEAGLLVRPDRCSECQRIRNIIAHHDDYAKPEEVRWLCRTCHSYWHKQNGPGANKHLKKNYPKAPRPPREPRVRKESAPKPVRASRPKDTERFAAMAALRADGWTLEQIGEKYGITRERVRQIIGTTNKPKSKEDSAFDRCMEVLAAYNEGLTHKDLRERFGLTVAQLALYELEPHRKFTHGESGYHRGCRCVTCTKAAVDRQRKVRHNLRARGLCLQCRNPSAGKTRCRECYENWYAKHQKPKHPCKASLSGIPGIVRSSSGVGWRVITYENRKQVYHGEFKELEMAKQKLESVRGGSAA